MGDPIPQGERAIIGVDCPIENHSNISCATTAERLRSNNTTMYVKLLAVYRCSLLGDGNKHERYAPMNFKQRCDLCPVQGHTVERGHVTSLGGASGDLLMSSYAQSLQRFPGYCHSQRWPWPGSEAGMLSVVQITDWLLFVCN